MSIASWVITALLAALFLMSAFGKFFPDPKYADIVEKMGYNNQKMFVLGIFEAGAVVLLLYPRTLVLGAVVLTGYIGGIIATHVSGNEPLWLPIALGVFVWLALYLRDARIRALLPLRQSSRTE